jgi:hypothetical protein
MERMLKKTYLDNLMEKHLGLIRKYTELKISPSEIDNNQIESVFRMIYPLMPDSLVIQTNESQFVDFCIQNLDKILPANSLS